MLRGIPVEGTCNVVADADEDRTRTERTEKAAAAGRRGRDWRTPRQDLTRGPRGRGKTLITEADGTRGDIRTGRVRPDRGLRANRYGGAVERPLRKSERSGNT